MRNSYLGLNPSWDSTIHMRNERCAKSCKWLGQVVELSLVKLITMQTIKQAPNSFRKCNQMYNYLSKMMTRMRRKEKESQMIQRSQVRLNYNSFIIKCYYVIMCLILNIFRFCAFSSLSDFRLWTFHFLPTYWCHNLSTT